MKHLKFIIPLILVILVSCSKENEDVNSSNTTTNGWLVDIEDIIHLDAEKDPIASIDSPEFINLASSTLSDYDMVLAYSHNDKVHVYPMSVMEAHEIVNDSIDDNFFAITHCPLTGSSIAWNRIVNGEPTSFGVSGKLYRENLIPYDRKSESNWSQMLSLCINGNNIGELAQTNNLLKTRFGTIKRSFPNALILNHESCDSSGCTVGFKTVLDQPGGDGSGSEINDAERYFGIVKAESLTLIPLSNMKDDIKVEHLTVYQKRSVLISSKKMSFIVIFNTDSRTYTAVQDNLPIIMKDDIGNIYNLFGIVISGPDVGSRLNSPNSYHAKTYAWKDIFEDFEIMDVLSEK